MEIIDLTKIDIKTLDSYWNASFISIFFLSYFFTHNIWKKKRNINNLSQIIPPSRWPLLIPWGNRDPLLLASDEIFGSPVRNSNSILASLQSSEDGRLDSNWAFAKGECETEGFLLLLLLFLSCLARIEWWLYKGIFTRLSLSRSFG